MKDDKRFLQPGEKIKKLRLELGLSQEDLSNDQVSKTLVSMIETGKRNLTYPTAVIISQNLNKYYGTMGREITPEFLMEEKWDLAQQQAIDEIEQLEKLIRYGNINDNLIINNLKIVENLILEYGLEKEHIKFKVLRGDYTSKHYQYKDALTDYIEAQHYYINQKEPEKVAMLHLSIGDVFETQYLFEMALCHYQIAIEVVRKEAIASLAEIEVRSIMKQVVCYRKMKRYDLVISLLNNYKGLEDDEALYPKYYFQLLLLEANSYRDVKNNFKAGKLYDRLMQEKKLLDHNTLYLTYINYGLYNLQMEKVERAQHYLKKADTLKDLIDARYKPYLYLLEAQCHQSLKDYNKALSLLENALTLAEWFSDPHMAIDINFQCVRLYTLLEDAIKAEEHIKGAEKIILEKGFVAKLPELNSYYIELNCPKEVRENISHYLQQYRTPNWSFL